MRFLFLLILIANVIVLAYGQGFFGTPPNEAGRDPHMLTLQQNPAIVTLGQPIEGNQAAAGNRPQP